MCGICGALGPPRGADAASLERMTHSLHHRGPDDRGTWSTETRLGDRPIRVRLGQTRLSIIDLSPLGHQPMTSRDGRASLVYNGELYNYRELREELRREGVNFRSQSDTEVLLEAYCHWGLEAVSRFNGMFAFAIWDEAEQRLVLGRDRLGIKPLYYRYADGLLTFGSELGALRAHDAFEPEIDGDALEAYLRYGRVTGQDAIYRDTHRLAPGELLVWQGGEIELRPYWQLSEIAPPDESASFDSAVDALEELLGDAVERRMLADVPLGAFLSGGIDSSAVVALMQERSQSPVRTFSIGFHEPSYNEAPHALAIAQHLHTDHTELYVGRDEARSVAVELPDLYDEPFADSSAIPTVLLSRLTRGHVTVSLSGDGGDELFGGYERYRKFSRLAPALALPRGIGRSLAPLSRMLGLASVANGLEALAGARDACELAEHFTALPSPRSLVLGDARGDGLPPPVYREAYEAIAYREPLRRMMAAEVKTYLVDDILTKVDRASMSVGLEARVPILDHRVVAFAMSQPLSILWHGGLTKAPLREILYRRVPRRLVDRPKMGFGIPIHALIADRLGAWTEHYLAPERIREEGLIDPNAVERMVSRAKRMGDGAAEYLWPILCYERWFARHHRGEELR